ncbi:MAG: FumA C-terminus/TtdB family hydratase beta subunit [Candidatus Ratteibacteria bacterium]|jgi:fumarate hydratase subunit beta
MNLILPCEKTFFSSLRPGDWLSLSGTLYGMRDAAHKRYVTLLQRGAPLPISLKNQWIYYVGPSPTKSGDVVGSCGPTTSIRMDPFTPALLEEGLAGMIGKGYRGEEVRKEIGRHGALYLITFGGCGAYLSRFIKKSEVIAFEDLGPESLFRFEVEHFPAMVCIDSRGIDFYGMKK